MRYLSIYGASGFRTFQGILTGKLLYAPDKIPMIDPEIIIEKDFSKRLQEVVSPYVDNHPKLSTILPVISSKIGEINILSEKCSLWSPTHHLSILGELLLAGLVENFLPAELSKELYFMAEQNDKGVAFQKAFSLEKKNILYPFDTKNILCPDDKTKVFSYDPKDKNLQEKLFNHQSLYLTQRNIFRIVGHIATMVHALYVTEETRQRFYNDVVSLVIPADNMEYVLAAYYLSKSKLPIKNIYAISTQHRMIHNFLTKGEFKLTDIKAYSQLEVSLDRMLFEAARGSVEKVVFWKKELQQTGSFKVDSKSFSSINLKFKSLFASPSQYQNVMDELNSIYPNSSKIALTGYALSKELSEHILIFDEEDQNIKDCDANLSSFTKKDLK